MKIQITLLFIFCIYAVFGNHPKTDDPLNTAKNANYLSPIEKEIVYEINLFRSNPAKYARDYIAPLEKYYDKKILHYPNDKSILTHEGVKALRECVEALKKASPKAIMQPSEALSKAAADHANDQAKTGKTGHTGSDRSDFKQRIERYGVWQKQIAENIAYGNSTARQIIIFLLIDDGVQNRGHRKNLLHPVFETVGVAYGSHPVYETMCVTDYAAGIIEK